MRIRLFLGIVLLSLIATVSAFAQDTEPTGNDVDIAPISDDAVNAIAEKLYCPVCENIPLDTCGTAACADWREEIRGMLAQGMSEEDIIDNFVVRFGDRVVSTPRDPVIAAISIITPWLVLAAISFFAIFQLFRWQKKQNVKKLPVDTPQESDARSSYLEQIEKDLTGK